MILYFDTSSLVKLFNREHGSLKVSRLVLDPDNQIWVLELALIELLSALFRKHRNNEISQNNLELIQKAIEDQFHLFNVIPFGSDIIKESRSLIMRFGKLNGLRTLDALHIAGFTRLYKPEWYFVSSDKTQLSVIHLLKMQTIEV